MTATDATLRADAARRPSGGWERADDLAQFVYRATWKFLRSDPDLAQRIRGIAISIAAQMEGASGVVSFGGSREALQTASAALGKLNYYLHFVRRAGLLGEADVKRIRVLCAGVERDLSAMLGSESTE